MANWHLKANPKRKNGKERIYYDIAENFIDENGKHQKKKIKYMGPLTIEQVKQYKLALRILNGQKLPLVSIDELKFTDSKDYLAPALINNLYDSLGINKAFYSATDNNNDLTCAKVTKALVINRCLDPCAHYKTVDWFKDTYLPEILEVDPDKYNKDKIFRELNNVYANRNKLQKLFYELSSGFNIEGSEIYFFDGTTSYFEGSCCDMADVAKDKTTGYQHKVIMICLITDKKGFPIVWEVFSARKTEVKEFQGMATKMAKQFGIKEITFCFDRGVASAANFKLIENKLSSKYITGLDQNQIEQAFNVDQFIKTSRDKLIKKHEQLVEQEANMKDLQKEIKKRKKQLKPVEDIIVPEKAKKRITPIDGFYKLGKDRFYKELGVKAQSRYVVSFNIEIYKAEQKTRLQNLEKIKAKIDELNTDFNNAKQDRKSKPAEDEIEGLLKKYRLQKVLDYKIVPKAAQIRNKIIQTYKISYEIIQEELEKKEKYDGLLVYITDHIKQIKEGNFEVTAADIVSHYKNKYVIENAFRHIKSFIELRPFYVYLEKHVIAHVDICMIAYFINTYIYHKLSEIGVSLNSFYSKLKACSKACTIDTGSDRTVSLLQTMPKEVLQIVKSLGASSLLSKGALEKLGIKK